MNNDANERKWANRAMNKETEQESREIYILTRALYDFVNALVEWSTEKRKEPYIVGH